METKYVINNRILILILFFLLVNNSIFAQSNPPIYLLFNENSKELCDVHQTRTGRLHTVKNIRKYTKAERSNGNIYFDICGELFIYDESKMDKRIVCKDFLKDKKLMNYEELVGFLNEMQDKYPMGYKYPSKEYPKIYIPIKLPNHTITLYEVKWEYYIE